MPETYRAEEYRQFYDAAAQRYGSPVNSKEENRIRQTVAHLPRDIHSALDVGCGDGRLLASLALDGIRIGTDFNFEFLKRFRGPGGHLQADIQTLPFRTATFDLVMCTEVLEHLPGEVLDKACSELDRVSRRYLLISVPNREDLRQDTLFCHSCGFSFHLYGHLRSFHMNTLPSLFPNAVMVGAWKIGAPETRYWSPLLWIRSLAKCSWDVNDTACPRCQQPIRPDSGLRKLVRRSCDYLQYRLLDGWLKQPYWLCALYQKSH